MNNTQFLRFDSPYQVSVIIRFDDISVVKLSKLLNNCEYLQVLNRSGDTLFSFIDENKTGEARNTFEFYRKTIKEIFD